MPSKLFYTLKKKDFLTKMAKNIAFSQILAFLFQLCNQYALKKNLRCITCLYVKNWRCWKFVPHPSHFWVSTTSRLLLKSLCNSGGWSIAQMKAYDLICLGNLSFGTFRAPELRYQGGVRTGPPPHGTVPQKAHIW